MRALLLVLAFLAASPAQAQTLSDLGWLRGCWRFTQGADVVTEVWTAPPMPAMLGYGYTRRDGGLRFWEQTRIEASVSGLAFVAMPRGGAAVRFPMLESGPNRVVFANPSHDFPQRLAYARRGDALTVTVSGAGAGDEIYPYRRFRCPAELRP